MTTSEQPRTYPAVRSYPFGPPERLDLNPMYTYLLENEPLSRVQLPYGEEAWLVVRHEDVRTVFSDPRFSRAAWVDHDEPRTAPHRPGIGILDMDPPEHSRLRRLVAKAFTARRIEELRPRAQQVAGELLDRMAAAGPPADLVDSYALPLPLTVMCQLLGVPQGDRDKFLAWTGAILSTTSLTPKQRADDLAQLSGYMAELIDQRRRAPADDLLDALIRARDEQDRLSEEELVTLAMGLLAAGHETTMSQISCAVYALLERPDQLRAWQRRPELTPQAVEELMRFIPLTAGATVPRYAIADVELSSGTVRAGEAVLASRSAANRDPRVFGNPGELDLTRAPEPHLGFGYGVHHCLGAQLARMELQVALPSLFGRFPDLRLAVPADDLRWKQGTALRGLLALPVAWGGDDDVSRTLSGGAQ